MQCGPSHAAATTPESPQSLADDMGIGAPGGKEDIRRKACFRPSICLFHPIWVLEGGWGASE